MGSWKSRATVAFGAAAALGASTMAGCLRAEIEENNRQLQQQRAELDRLKQEVAALQASTLPRAPAATGSCDAAVSRVAARRGGEKFAAGDFSRALEYYHDALAACPSSAKAELNLARTYEAMGEVADAIAHYRIAAKGGGEGGDDAARQAHDALSRLGTK
jgi:tetratricopeptide (TPR) repeat protein